MGERLEELQKRLAAAEAVIAQQKKELAAVTAERDSALRETAELLKVNRELKKANRELLNTLQTERRVLIMTFQSCRQQAQTGLVLLP